MANSKLQYCLGCVRYHYTMIPSSHNIGVNIEYKTVITVYIEVGFWIMQFDYSIEGHYFHNGPSPEKRMKKFHKWPEGGIVGL